MMHSRWVLPMVALLGAVGCGPLLPGEEHGQASPEYTFETAIQINPKQPVPGRRVFFTIEMVNTGGSPLVAELELRVASKGEASKLLFLQRWDAVSFGPKENWNMTQSFIPETDAALGPYDVGLKVRVPGEDQSTGTIYYDNPKVAELQFFRSTGSSPDAGTGTN